MLSQVVECRTDKMNDHGVIEVRCRVVLKTGVASDPGETDRPRTSGISHHDFVIIGIGKGGPTKEICEGKIGNQRSKQGKSRQKGGPR